MKYFRNALAILLTATLLAVALCACTGDKPPASASPDGSLETSNSEPIYGGEVTVGIGQDLEDSLDPHNMEAAGTREVLFNVFEGLVKPTSDGNLIPAVASDYSIENNGATFVFTLRDNVLFHNGAVVTVGDVVYSLERCMGKDRSEPLVSAFAAVKSVEATNDKTVVVNLNSPNPEFLADLTVAIIPQDYDSATPVGTGPFRFASHTPLESVVLEKFDGYWGTPAYLDKVTFQIIGNADTIAMSLESGAMDICPHITTTQSAGLSDDFYVLEGTMNLVQAVYLNNAVAPLDRLEVRQALSHAIDRDAIMLVTGDGRGTAIGSSMYPAFQKYFMPELSDYYDYNPETAKQMLADAGYPDGFDLTITVPDYTQHIETAQVVAEQFKAIGVNVTIQQVDMNTWLEDVYQNRNYEATIIGFDAKTLTARAMLERFSSTASADSINISNFSNDEYDETLAAAMSATDEETQVALYKRCEEILTEQAANLYIQDLCDLVAIRGNLSGYTYYPLYAIDMSKVYYTG
ncbi:MAG: ABC transporter substrate-binding protein [Oscillospiraceae bacterium]|nr:ABC transporter substrate-binding protein [Oscillospiraceae bacterium]